MTCTEAKAHLWEYYDDACEPRLRRELEGHLTSCRSCQQALDEWMSLSQQVFHERAPKAPPYLWTRVLAGIEAREAESTAWWAQWRWMSRVTVAASLVVAIGSTYLFRQWTAPGMMESMLKGQPSQNAAIQLASAKMTTSDEVATIVLEEGE